MDGLCRRQYYHECSRLPCFDWFDPPDIRTHIYKCVLDVENHPPTITPTRTPYAPPLRTGLCDGVYDRLGELGAHLLRQPGLCGKAVY